MLIAWAVLLLEGLITKLFIDMIPVNGTVVFLPVILVNALCVFGWIALKYREERKVLFALLGGFLLRLGLLTWDLYGRSIFKLPNSGLDTESYDSWARQLFRTGQLPRGGVYPRFIAFWYSLFNIQRPIAQYVNILLAMTAIWLVIRTMDDLAIEKGTRLKAVLLMCFLPNFAITNSILLRETLIMFLATCSLAAFVRYIADGNLFLLLVAVLTAIAASAVHSGAMAVLLGETVTLILYDRQMRGMKITPKSIALTAAAVVGFLIMFSLLHDVLFAKFGNVDSAEDIINTAEKYNAGGSAYQAGFRISNPTLNLIINSPIRMFYFIASPLPWNWRGLSDIIAFCFSSSVFLYAHFRSYIEIRRSERSLGRTLIIVVTIIALCAALIFAWGVSNAGTAVRHREKFMTVYILLIALCGDSRTTRIKALREAEN